MYCEFCGDELMDLDGFMRIDAKFCDDKCRSDYHNHKRKMQRAKERAFSAMYDLFEAAQAGDVTGISNKAIRQMADFVNSIRYQCSECGQSVFHVPVSDERCDFCQSAKWKIVSMSEAHRDIE